jgi:hypothetical protein
MSALISTPFLRGLGGLLLNGEIGVLVFVPWVVLSVICLPAFFREHKSECGLCVAIVLLNVAFFSVYSEWHGGMVAGPRFLVPTLPFLILVLAPGMENFRAQKIPMLWPRAILRFVALVLVFGALLIQAVGILYPESRYYTLMEYYENKSVKPWWSGSIPLASFDFLSQIRSQGNAFMRRPQPIDSDSVSVDREQELAFTSMASAANKEDFLRSFPNSLNLILPDLLLFKIKWLGLPRAALYLYFIVSAMACLLGIVGIRADNVCRSEIRSEVTCA